MLRDLLRQLYAGPAKVQLRRFVTVGILAAAIQMILLWGFVDVAGRNYLLGAIVAIEATIVLQYVLNNRWTFQHYQNTGTIEYITGLLKTNVVRGTAIPIQLSVLFVLVEWRTISYLVANAIAIVISGVYRYILDARWTWNE